jgi:hypothetical protein
MPPAEEGLNLKLPKYRQREALVKKLRFKNNRRASYHLMKKMCLRRRFKK